MVIQRQWRGSNQSTESSSVHHTSSSEDSNSSWQTLSNSTTSSLHRNGSTNTIASTSKIPVGDMADSVLKALKSRYNGRNSMQQSTDEIAEYSMELMRLNVQTLFDKEIETIVQKYIETYFTPALKNVRENLDDTTITDDYLQKISCDLLENTKQQYCVGMPSTTVIKTEPTTSTTIKQEYNSVYDKSMYFYKAGPCKRKDSTSSSSELSSSDQSPTHQSAKRIYSNVHLKSIGRSKPLLWNAANLSTETYFVLDYKANRALGFVEKERLTSLHPELMRYIVDADDKDWLIQHRILSPAYKHFRVLLLVLDEVNKLAQSDEYRSRSTLKLNELSGFKVADFMVQKMKIFFDDLSQKSQNLLTTPSFIITNSGTSSAALAKMSSGTSSTSTSSTIPLNVTAISPTHVVVVESTRQSNKPSASRSNATSSAGASVNRSSLSSSHATLSALLSNSTENATADSTD